MTRNDKWRVGAGAEISGFPYKSSEVSIDVSHALVSVDIVLIKFSTAPIPLPVTISQPATQQVVAQTTDGAKMIIPPGAAAQNGSVSIEIKPTSIAPTNARTEVIGTVYDITVKDQGGTAITKLQQDIEITLPYKEEDLKAQGIIENSVVPSFFDEKTGTWVKLDKYIVDKENDVVVARVKHLTRFALVAAADIVPPSAPASVSAKRSGSGKILLSWVNPASDFRHTKVYQSITAGTLGNVVFAEVRGSSQEVAGLTDGLRYYFTVRAVDPAGNESTNADQIAVAPAAMTEVIVEAAKSGGFQRDLTFGVTNDSSVKALQELLTKLGLYSGPTNGNFFNLTRQAVTAFQLQKGIPAVGRVGPQTRAKLNELLGGTPSSSPTPTPAAGGPFQFLRDLAFGATDNSDVKALQELLTKLGVYDGPITGNFFNLTKAAVEKFQAQYGIPAVGRVGPLTRAKLNELAK
ncbi:MAG: peptidoglycan-binding protein [Parcubacteria group bacterium]|nr:peptidoglycan-binding protein [Parcubacteria group bacterium]